MSKEYKVVTAAVEAKELEGTVTLTDEQAAALSAGGTLKAVEETAATDGEKAE